MQRILESLTNDRAEALIREAVTGDRDLFRMLLSESAPKSDKAATRIIETLAALSGGAVSDLPEIDGRGRAPRSPLEITVTEPAR